MKLSPAAIRMALRMESARVEMHVAIAFAVSWKPLMKSNARAAKITSASRNSGASGILQRHALEHVGGVLAPVGGRFQRLVDLFPLQDVHGVLLVLEEPGDRVPADPVRLVLEGVHLDAMLVDVVPPLGRRKVDDPLLQLLGALEDEEPELPRVRGALDHLVEEQPRGRRVDQVDHVVEGRRQREDVLPVDRRDERRVQLLDDLVGEGVALVLHLLDPPDPLPQVVELLQEVLQPLRPLDDVRRRLLEENEELLVPRNDPEHHPSPAMRARAAAAPPTRSSRISCTGWIFFTNATLWPAMSDPCSTSPSTTARRSAPTQNSSSLTWASSRGTWPAFTLFSRSSWSRLKSFVPSLMIARTGIVGSDGSNCVVGMASRAEARTNASLNLGCAPHSSAATNRVPSWTPAAPSERYWAMISPVPIPPATNTGTSVTFRRNSCARTEVDTGPTCPPASFPSITRASIPCLMRRLASGRTGAKQTSFSPAAFTSAMSRPAGMLPAKKTNGHLSRTTTSTCRLNAGATVMRFTPKGFRVFSRVFAISFARTSGGMLPPASTPNPPSFEMAATRFASETQVIAPHMIA